MGAVLVYAATGRSPFEAENAYLAAYTTVHGEPDLGRLPRPLRPLVTACLTKDPAGRPTSGEVLKALAALPEELPDEEPADQPSPGPVTALTDTAMVPARAKRRGRRMRTVVAGAAVLAVAATAVTASVLASSDTSDRAVVRAAHPSASTPAGWKPWHNALESDDKTMDMKPACTPDALGVFCSSPQVALMRLSPATGRVDWTRPMSEKKVSSFSLSEPVVHDGVVYVNSADRSEGLDAYDGRTGKRLWHLDGPLGGFSALGGVLLVRLDPLGTSRTARYAAHEPRTGAELWRRTLTGNSAQPFYEGSQGLLYADLRGGSGGIARVDARTGRNVGVVDAPKGDLWLATVHDGTAYYARWENDSGVSAAFFIQDLRSGRTRRIDFPWSVDPEAPPLVRGDAMYIFDYDHETLLALDLRHGKPLWTSDRDLRVFSEPSLHDGRLYVTMPDTSVLALDPRTGQEIGRTGRSFDTTGQSFEELSPSGVPPLLVGSVLYGVSGPGVFSVGDVTRPAEP
ncbi:PQQ-binding-like beta-propeller repeat protein [Streptomyces sp. NPDC005799]|uniref:outer membrane protein assembly factor BamB family protein n=1 Tax=Streptomyces sp. NPDC005799 TaxID=3154678 RepID=UPI0033E78933